MANLRIKRLKVVSSTQITIEFTATLDSGITINNITIEGANSSTPDLDVLSVSTSGNVLTINTRPMVDRAYYKLTLASTATDIIKGARGERFLEDGATNIVYFIGEIEENEIRDEILNDIPDIYNKESDGLIFDAIDSSAKSILDLSHDAGEVESANYVSIEVEDEEVTRGSGAFDRFANEGVYQILRVGSSAAGATTQDTLSFEEFPSDPVSLQQISVSEEEVSNTANEANSFSGLTITLANGPVISVSSIKLIRGTTEYTYNISQYKYGILDSKYDSSNSYDFLTLTNNQIKLTNSAIGPTFPFPSGNDKFEISYKYKRLGRIIDSDTIEIATTADAVRESVEAVATTFFLDHAPIVDSSGDIPRLNGVTFLDPSVNFDPTQKHPAFVTEIVYNQADLPSSPGQYTINYTTGQVFVYGVDGSGTDGTTTIPPVATYKFKQTFQNGLDYVFFSDLNEVASLPDRDLRGNAATITFDYEDTFAEGTDYNVLSHIEVIGERVENRLIDTIGLYTLNNQVEEVFRIFNETTGEIYTPIRITGNQVYFSSSTPPRIVNVEREAAQFEQIIQAQLVVTEEVTITGKPFVAFRIELPDTDIGSAIGNFIGASFNTTLTFSDVDIFLREFFYDPSDILADNLVRLQQVGDYMVDYESGVIYLARVSGASSDIGDASYRRGKIQTRNDHIIRVNDIYRSSSVNVDNTETFRVGTITDTTVITPDLENAGERTLADGTTIVVVAGSSGNTVTVRDDVFRVDNIFQVTDLLVCSNPIDFSTNAVVSSSSGNTIVMSSSGVAIDDDNDGTGLTIQTAGSRLYVSAERIASMFASSLVSLVSASVVSGLNNSINYFTQGSDGYVDDTTNRIYLPSTTTAVAGSLAKATYNARLRGGAAVLVDYISGRMFLDYTYCADELLIDYEYGDNVLDWSISSTLSEGDTYFVTYRYGALRNSIRDNFGVLTGIEELSTIPELLDRETYRNAVKGSLQSFPKGPTIPSIKGLVSALTQIDPNITESVFLEWILGRDYFHLKEMELEADTEDELPTYEPGKFGNGLLLNTDGQSATIPANSNLRFEEGTWEAFVVPEWAGIDNDALITFDISFDGTYRPDLVYIGSNNTNPTEIPFTLNREDSYVLGRPSNLHNEVGYFIWYDSTFNKWRLRVRAPITENRLFTGNLSTTGEFYDVKEASTADGYDGYDGYSIDEANDSLWSTDESIAFSFIVDAYDSMNMAFDAYDAYNGSFAGFDGIDFTSDNIHYFFDTGVLENQNRMSLFKDGKGFLRFKVYDDNNRIKMLSTNIQNWARSETHHIAASWKMNTIEMRDELHLFVDGQEVPNTYKFKGYLEQPSGTVFMDEASETLVSSATIPTIGGFDGITNATSDVFTSPGSQFITKGVAVGSKFVILDNTTDGNNTETSPYVYVRAVMSETQLQLETGPVGSAIPYNAVSSLTGIRFSVNPVSAFTVSDPDFEKVRVFSIDSGGAEVELYSPETLTPDYAFGEDGYQDYVDIYNGIDIGDGVVLRSYGLSTARCRQLVYIWPDLKTNILSTIMPQPTDISKINITTLIVRKIELDPGVFAIVATAVGGHIIPVLVAGAFDFCQPSNSVTGRRLKAIISGPNFDFTGVNKVIIAGTTTDGYNSETLSFSALGSQTTTRYFTSITDILASFTPIDITESVGTIEVREANPLNWQENSGEYAEVLLSVQEQAGTNGRTFAGSGKFMDAYSRWGSEDIGKTINITWPSSIANSYTITDVELDPSGTVKDSNTIFLNTTWTDAYDAYWKQLTTSHGDSGFANGLITLEIARSGGQPFLLRSCWYEVDFPTFLTVPWGQVPESLYTGSDLNSANQANAVIDEMRILDEISDDTGRGELTPSSGRSITTDAQVVQEYEDSTQTLGLFHFNDSVENSASFYSSFSDAFRQSENSVNSLFGQSGVFNQQKSLQYDNASIFNNNSGTIEFWVSPILDTYNDPTRRFYVDLSPEQQLETTAVSAVTVILPVRARTVRSVTITGSDTNFFTGGSLASDGTTITLGQALPRGTRNVTVIYVPITAQGDRFSIYKSETGFLTLSVSASDVDYQIRAPIYWKKNTWHRVWVGWDLNNTDNQDRLILMVDGTEAGVIRYGTGLLYGQGHLYGSPTVWGSATAGTISARNILADINLLDVFNTVHIGADFTGQFTAMARFDNMRFSSELRSMTYLGGSGPGQLIGKDLLYTGNVNTAQPVVSDALTRLLLDFDTTPTEVEHLATVRDLARGIFDFYVEVIDTFELIDTSLAQGLLTDLINRLRPGHTRAFVSFTK
jgi:hypothetical protein